MVRLLYSTIDNDYHPVIIRLYRSCITSLAKIGWTGLAGTATGLKRDFEVTVMASPILPAVNRLSDHSYIKFIYLVLKQHSIS